MSYLVVPGLDLLDVLLLRLLLDAHVAVEALVPGLRALVLAGHLLPRAFQQLVQQHELVLVVLEDGLLGLEGNGSAEFVDQPHLEELVDQSEDLVGAALALVRLLHLQALKIIFHCQR